MHIIGRCNRKYRRSIDIRATGFLDNVAGLDRGMDRLLDLALQAVEQLFAGAVVATLGVANPARDDFVNGGLVGLEFGAGFRADNASLAAQFDSAWIAGLESASQWRRYAVERARAGRVPSLRTLMPYPIWVRLSRLQGFLRRLHR